MFLVSIIHGKTLVYRFFTLQSRSGRSGHRENRSVFCEPCMCEFDARAHESRVCIWPNVDELWTYRGCPFWIEGFSWNDGFGGLDECVGAVRSGARRDEMLMRDPMVVAGPPPGSDKREWGDREIVLPKEEWMGGRMLLPVFSFVEKLISNHELIFLLWEYINSFRIHLIKT
jgi:hypothetical protein